MTQYFSPRMLNRMRGSKEKRSVSCRCASDHIHDSRAEARHCDTLLYRLKAKEIISYDRQKTFSFDIGGVHICSHRVDFLVEYKDGHSEVEEVKGFPTPEWAIKHKLFLALYPSIPYHVITPGKGKRVI